MTIKEYAQSRGISYEATRKAIQRHLDELQGHITIEGRTRCLDDQAVKVLDQHRTKTTAPQQNINQEQIYIHELQMEIIKLQDTIINLQEQYRQALLDSNSARLALEAQTSTTEKITRELESLQTEIRSYHRTIFGLYRKIG